MISACPCGKGRERKKHFPASHLTIRIVVYFNPDTRNSFIVFIVFINKDVIIGAVVIIKFNIIAIDVRHIIIAAFGFRVGFFQRYDFRSRCIVFVFIIFRLFFNLGGFRRARGHYSLEDRPAFRAGNRIAVKIVIFGAAARAQPLCAKFRFCHCAHPS